MKERKAHKFTWDNKTIAGNALSKKLGVSVTCMYSWANRAKSDCGEEIIKIGDIPHEPQKQKNIKWKGGDAVLADVARELGIEKGTLRTRINRYGEDHPKTFVPGKISTTFNINHGNDTWKNLGSKPRTRNLAKIGSLGTWEARQ